jgi:uncharacterized phage-associated protein
MTKVDNIAAAILKRTGSINTFKLQKLVYYSEAWHLVWESESLFEDRIEAWANGPVVPALYQKHRTKYIVDAWPDGDAGALSDKENESIDAVLAFYGEYQGYQLAELTHQEEPWIRAREGLGLGERGNAEISRESMRIFYEGLVGNTAKPIY